ncbi:MAG: hypothetical protein M3Q10_14405 [Chloroflexota bacterium]|nr:hypothetical protein [Chloroflexota bacterium]
MTDSQNRVGRSVVALDLIPEEVIGARLIRGGDLVALDTGTSKATLVLVRPYSLAELHLPPPSHLSAGWGPAICAMTPDEMDSLGDALKAGAAELRQVGS